MESIKASMSHPRVAKKTGKSCRSPPRPLRPSAIARMMVAGPIFPLDPRHGRYPATNWLEEHCIELERKSPWKGVD